MTPGNLDLIIYQGSTFKQPISWKTGPLKLPVDMTGFKVRMHIREKLNLPDILVSLNTENGGIELTTPLAGVFTLKMSASDTSLLTFKRAVYDLEIVYPDNTVIRLLEGSVSLSLEVTR
jgi:hypothetical protein